MFDVSNVKCGQFVRFAYPASDGSGPKVREGVIDRISDAHQTVTLKHKDGSFKAFSARRIVGNVEVLG